MTDHLPLRNMMAAHLRHHGVLPAALLYHLPFINISRYPVRMIVLTMLPKRAQWPTRNAVSAARTGAACSLCSTWLSPVRHTWRG